MYNEIQFGLANNFKIYIMKPLIIGLVSLRGWSKCLVKMLSMHISVIEYQNYLYSWFGYRVVFLLPLF